MKLENIISCMDRLFIVMFSGKKNKTAAANGDKSGALVWTEVSRTEQTLVVDYAEYGTSYVEQYIHQFSVLQCPITAAAYQDASLLMVAVYKVDPSSNTDGSGGGGGGDATSADLHNHIALCRCIVPKSSLMYYNNDAMKLFTVSMSVLIDIPIDISSPVMAHPLAMLGVFGITSHTLGQRRSMMKVDKHVSNPYCESLYCFPAMGGNVAALEQLTAMKHGSTVAQALLSFFIQERSPVVANEWDRVEHLLNRSNDTIKQIQANPDLHATLAVETQKNEMFDRAMCDIELLSDSMIEDFAETHNHFACVLNPSYKVPNSIMKTECGGNGLRRSTWKKRANWQYCTTNLNLQLFSFQRMAYSEMIGEGGSLPPPAASSSSSVLGTRTKSSSGTIAHTPPSEPKFIPSITLGCPSAHGMKFHEGGLLKILGGVHTSSASRIEWMRLLQSWTETNQLFDKIQANRQDLSQSSIPIHNVLTSLFPTLSAYTNEPPGQNHVGLDIFSVEGKSQVWVRRSFLSNRIDVSCSQALGTAISVIKSMLVFAIQVGGVYRDILARSLKIGFLIPFQSYLSTQGDELGMLEDLDCAALWLSVVSVRLVVEQETRASPPKESEPVDPQNQCKYTKAHISRNSCQKEDGSRIPVGRSEDLKIRRGKNGGIVVDVALSAGEAAVVEQLMKSVAACPDPSGVGEVPKAEVTYGVDEVQPSVLCTTSLFGVVFSQGVNEMQTLVNMSGAESVHRQVEINHESINRLCVYYKKYKQVMVYQIRAYESRVNGGAGAGDKQSMRLSLGRKSVVAQMDR